jgi:hypothetical protein
MPHRFLPLAALIYVCVSVALPAHAQAQQGAAGAVRGRIVDSVTGRAVSTATVHLALVRGSDTAGAGNLTSRGLHLNGPRIHAR